MKTNVILVVEDEHAIKDMIRYALSASGYDVIEASCVDDAEALLTERLPNLILLDWMLPGKNGIEFAQLLKRRDSTRHIPIIMLTAKAEEEHKIKGFEVGADDYITKPFSPREMIARIKSLLRRSPLITTDDVIHLDCMRLNINSQQLTIAEEVIALSPIEYKLLYFMMTHQDRTYSREQLLNHVWGRDKYIDERTVDVHIRRLRNKLSLHGCEGYIKTIRATGYQFSGKTS